MNYEYFTSESVCAGHPDKICDQISDAIVDAAISVSPYSRVAVETLVTKNHTTIAGEVMCPCSLPYANLASRVIRTLGYDNPAYDFHHESQIAVLVHEQSPDIAAGVENGGAGDQGMMFGYAVNETPHHMPLPIMLAHALAAQMDELKKTTLTYLRPDGKSQVRVRYENKKPVEVDRVVLAVPHDPKIDLNQIKHDLYSHAVCPILDQYGQKPLPYAHLVVNGTGKWEFGGPACDTGVTGRKIIVDTYGGMARTGGGCFSGKDVTKVDRSAAYGARFLAKNIVAANMAQRCEVQVSYVIGHKKPLSQSIDTFGTENKPTKYIESFAWELLDMHVPSIIERLKLRQPIYEKTARYGHFGYSEYPWEQIIV